MKFLLGVVVGGLVGLVAGIATAVEVAHRPVDPKMQKLFEDVREVWDAAQRKVRDASE